jgi:hypothetical protein
MRNDFAHVVRDWLSKMNLFDAEMLVMKSDRDTANGTVQITFLARKVDEVSDLRLTVVMAQMSALLLSIVITYSLNLMYFWWVSSIAFSIYLTNRLISAVAPSLMR